MVGSYLIWLLLRAGAVPGVVGALCWWIHLSTVQKKMIPFSNALNKEYGELIFVSVFRNPG